MQSVHSLSGVCIRSADRRATGNLGEGATRVKGEVCVPRQWKDCDHSNGGRESDWHEMGRSPDGEGRMSLGGTLWRGGGLGMTSAGSA